MSTHLSDPGWRLLILLLLLSVLAACHVPMPPASNRLEEDKAPTPFSADQIRDACPSGRWVRYRYESKGRPLMFETTTYLDCDEGGARIETSNKDEKGKDVGEKRSRRVEWRQLQAYASFPQKQTQIEHRKLKIPAGTYDCWHYEVYAIGDGMEVIRRYWFSKSHPGPPIHFEQLVDGERIVRVTLVESGMPAR